MNILTFDFKATFCNGYPKIKIFLDDDLLTDHEFSQTGFQFSINLNHSRRRRQIRIQRYGKTYDNWSQEQDQTLEIVGVDLDGIAVPPFVLQTHSRFEFDDQIHPGSLYFGPNGIWYFDFETPLIQWVLDQKILHEAQYNQDYKYPWSYKLGPDSVSQITTHIDQALAHVKTL